MFCTNCLSNGAEENACLVCRAPCTLMKLVPDMNSDIQDYFTEPEELLKKSCDIIQFQRRHRHRLLSYLLQATKKFHTARNELKRMTEICQKQHKQLKEYQRIIKHLHTQVVTQSTTVSIEPRDPDEIKQATIRSNTSHKISSTVMTPPTPESVGYNFSQGSDESGYMSNGPPKKPPVLIYCSGSPTRKCTFLNKRKYFV
ncbi:unnamed protein product [Leptidea sinapis]|uniref:Uncharacterized protein n=1 Tax=Leptidea sinapis TaxID=189913 RepID=A0A5E4QFA8_9NEOP|nr:unnamed protein product [Leptidea sinapis]